MPLEKQSLNNFLPDGFETNNLEGYKENFSADKIATGYEKDVKDRVSGPIFNNLLDVLGKNTNVLTKFMDFIKNMPINNLFTVDENNQLVYKNLDELGGGGQYVGQTIFSFDPLYEDGLHLPDGALLYVGGMYDEYINKYIANLFVKAPHRFCNEEEWQTSVATYGVCSKYVYTEGVSVRLPKVTGIVEGTLDANALGEIVEAGLPNAVQYLGRTEHPTSDKISGKVYSTTTGSTFTDASYAGDSLSYVGIDLSLSNPIYGNSNTVQPQTVQGYLYIVVATGSKTEIEVNIDNIATDLNGKADTDLTNVTNQAKALMSTMGMPSTRYVDLTLGASTSTYVAPANGYFYINKMTSANGQYLNVGNNDTGIIMVVDKSGTSSWCTILMPVLKGQSCYVTYTAGGKVNNFRFYYAVGSEGEV